MKNINKANIENKLKEVTAERDNFLVEVNKQLAFYNGRIAELEDLLNPEEDKETSDKKKSGN